MSVAVMTGRASGQLTRRVLPPPETVKVSFDARAEQVRELDELAHERQVSRADVLRAAVREYTNARLGEGAHSGEGARQQA